MILVGNEVRFHLCRLLYLQQPILTSVLLGPIKAASANGRNVDLGEHVF